MVKPDRETHIGFYFPNAVYLSAVRSNAVNLAAKMGFDDDSAFDIGLALDEAYVNAVEHGAESCKAEIYIDFYSYSDRIEIEVKDTGKGFLADKHSIPSDLHNITSVRGRGLALIKFLMDGLYVESEPGRGTVIRFVKYLDNLPFNS